MLRHDQRCFIGSETMRTRRSEFRLLAPAIRRGHRLRCRRYGRTVVARRRSRRTDTRSADVRLAVGVRSIGRAAEGLGGLTTFVSMAYIIVVNPAILGFAGIPHGPSTVATILTAAFGTLLMGLYANRPIAVAPYMGENAFIAFGLAAFGITWQQRLGAVFVSGVIFFIITILGIRTWLAEAVSPSMKHSFAAGIGLFLTFIGLFESGIVT